MKSVAPRKMIRCVLRLVTVLFALVLPGGCGKPDPGPPNMMREVLGALQIRDAKERDVALAAACRESADQGSAPAVLMGVPRIEDASLRDEVASDCAATLEEAGLAEAAVDVAKLISDEAKRNELLARLKP